MKYANSVKAATAGMIIGSSLFLTACGSSDSGTSSTGNTSISGTAATGAAMTSGTVTLKCGSSVTRTATISATGTWSTTVPTVNLPCAVEATDGTNSYYSFTVGNGSSIVSNVTPLTTLTLAQILGATPASLFASLSATDLAKLNTSAINAAIAALNAALASYALPAGFNPVTTPLTAATSTQSGNAYDDLLEQFGAANTDLTALVTAAATGTLPTLATPSYTPGVTSLEDFFTTFAGDYTLKVTSVASEGVSAGAAALFPLDSARGVSIKANGDVTFAAVGRTITYAAADYNRDFMGTASTQNQVRYRRKDNNWLELYITYDPATGELHADPSGFLSNDEGLAMLKGTVFVPPTTAPGPVTCNSGTLLTFSGTASGLYNDGQVICFTTISTTTLAFPGKTLTAPTQNTAVTAPYSAWKFVDGNYTYEVIFNNGAVHEINLSNGSGFLGQFAAATSGGGGGTLTVSNANPVSRNGTLAITAATTDIDPYGNPYIKAEGTGFLVRAYYNTASGQVSSVAFYWDTEDPQLPRASTFCTGTCGVVVNTTAGTATLTATALSGEGGMWSATLNGTITGF
jgi:hypothetical protein